LTLYRCEDDITSPTVNCTEKIVFVSVTDLSDPTTFPYICSINIDGTNFKQLTSDQNYYSTEPVISIQNMRVIYESTKDGTPDIFSMNLDGSEQINLTGSLDYDFSPQVSDDDNLIVFQRHVENNGFYGGPKIFKMGIIGGNITNLNKDSLSYGLLPLINAKYKLIIYAVYVDAIPRLCSMDYDGNNRIVLTDSTLYIGTNKNDYKISGDGEKITFVASNATTSQQDLYIMNIDGTELRNLTNNSENESFPEFNPANTHIVYDNSGHYGGSRINAIKIISVEGGACTTLVEMEKASFPVYNPKGDKILFVAEINGHYNIFSIDINGNNIFNITKSNRDDFMPLFIP
jgi:Tol biopolymer transport system component